MLADLKKILLVLFVLIVAGLSSFAQGGYTRSDLWDKEIDAFIQGDKTNFPKPSGILFVGGSSIRMWKTLAEDFPGYATTNRGFGGAQMDDVDHYVPQIVIPYKPKLIVLYAGDNDIAGGRTPEQVVGDFKIFVSLVHKDLPKTRIIFISLKPSPSRWSMAAQYRTANQLIKAETERSKYLLFVDVWSVMLGPDGKPKSDIFQDDRLHMNAKGYEIWRQTLLPSVKRGAKKTFR